MYRPERALVGPDTACHHSLITAAKEPGVSIPVLKSRFPLDTT